MMSCFFFAKVLISASNGYKWELMSDDCFKKCENGKDQFVFFRLPAKAAGCLIKTRTSMLNFDAIQSADMIAIGSFISGLAFDKRYLNHSNQVPIARKISFVCLICFNLPVRLYEKLKVFFMCL